MAMLFFSRKCFWPVNILIFTGIKILRGESFFSCFFAGDLKKSDQVLAWLTDDDNRELPGEIEAVNGKLFNRVLSENDFVLAYFCNGHSPFEIVSWPLLSGMSSKWRGILFQMRRAIRSASGCSRSWRILTTNAMRWVISVDSTFFFGLLFIIPLFLVSFFCFLGIDFVKVKDPAVAEKYGLYEFPALIYFRKQNPIKYDGKNIQKQISILLHEQSMENCHKLNKSVIHHCFFCWSPWIMIEGSGSGVNHRSREGASNQTLSCTHTGGALSTPLTHSASLILYAW